MQTTLHCIFKKKNIRNKPMELSCVTISILVISGILVGLLNTYAGAAAALTFAIFSALGMPITAINGTNRIPVIFQTLTMSIGFKKQGVLNVNHGLKLATPTIAGAIIGAYYAAIIPPSIFEVLLGGILLLLLGVLLYDPKKFLKPRVMNHKVPRKCDYFWFLLIGLYGGMFHVGVGYVILTVAILSMGYNLVEASAIKGFIVLLYAPVTLLIFISHDHIWYAFGILHGLGNVVGAAIATSFAKKIPMNLIRWSLVAMITITALDLFGIIELKVILQHIFKLFI